MPVISLMPASSFSASGGLSAGFLRLKVLDQRTSVAPSLFAFTCSVETYSLIGNGVSTNLYENVRVASLNDSSCSLITGPSLIESALTAPGLLLLPLMISSLMTDGCHLSRLSKSLTVAPTLSDGALIVVVSTTLSCSGADNAVHRGR